MPPKYEPLAADGDDGGPACVRWDQARWWDAMYSWVTPLIALGTTRQLRHTDLPELPPKMRIGRAIEDLRGGLDGSRLAREAEDCLGARTDGPKALFPDGSLLGVIFHVYWRQQLQSLGFEFCREGCAVLVTVAMRRVILFMEDADRPPWEGYMLVSLAVFYFLCGQRQSCSPATLFFPCSRASRCSSRPRAKRSSCGTTSSSVWCRFTRGAR